MKHGRAAMVSDTAGREQAWEALHSAAAASDRAGRERGAGCGGARLRTREGWPVGALWRRSARDRVGPAQRGAWHARWRQRVDERARRGARETDRWDPTANFIPN
jgi:hypothetical protein